MTTIQKIIEFFGGDALASMDVSEPCLHDRRFAACWVGLGRGRGGDGHPWLALFFSRVTRKLIVMEVSSSWPGKNACTGQFLAVKPTLGVDFWQRSGTHEPRQRATMLLKLGVSNA